MGKRLLSYDPISGIKEWHDYDHSDRKTRIITEQDCQKVLDFNKACRNTPELRSNGLKNDFMHFARVPNNVIVKWKNDHNVDVFKKEDLPKIEKLLQSSEYKYLRSVDRI